MNFNGFKKIQIVEFSAFETNGKMVLENTDISLIPDIIKKQTTPTAEIIKITEYTVLNKNEFNYKKDFELNLDYVKQFYNRNIFDKGLLPSDEQIKEQALKIAEESEKYGFSRQSAYDYFIMAAEWIKNNWWK